MLEVRSAKWVSLGWNPGVGRIALLLEALGKNLPFPASRGCLRSSAHGSFCHVQSQDNGEWSLLILLPSSPLLLWPSCLLLMRMRDYVGPTQVMQDDFNVLNLITPAASLLPQMLPYSQFLRIKTWLLSLGTIRGFTRTGPKVLKS